MKTAETWHNDEEIHKGMDTILAQPGTKKAQTGQPYFLWVMENGGSGGCPVNYHENFQDNYHFSARFLSSMNIIVHESHRP